MLLRMHAFPAGKHEFAGHQAAALYNQVFEEAHRLLLRDLLDETFPGITIGAPAATSVASLCG